MPLPGKKKVTPGWMRIMTADLTSFTPEEIHRAGDLLECPADTRSILKALIIQRDTGLSIARGEIAIVPFNGRPTVCINKQGYVSYATRQSEYEGYSWGFINEDGPLNDLKVWVKVYRKGLKEPVYEEISYPEFARVSPIWRQMPKHMLKVRCLSLALRDAFPLLNGTLTRDEIEDEQYAVRTQSPGKGAESSLAQESPSSGQGGDVKSACGSSSHHQRKTYSRAYALIAMENMKNQGMNLDIFEKARISDFEYDKQMIDEDFHRQLAAKKSPGCSSCSPPSMSAEDCKNS